MARDIGLLLVTGAGASTDFGADRKPLPLMAEWSERLSRRLFESGVDPYGLSLLRPGMDGPAFEAALGDFLRQAEAFMQVRGVVELSAKTPSLGSPQLKTWYDQIVGAFDNINATIVSSLMAEFHHSRLAVSDAVTAYGELLRMAGISVRRLVYATTNYDALGELALQELGAHIDSGEPTRQYGGHATGLDVADLLEGGRTTPVFHLHGKAGWYRDDRGRVQVLDVQQHHPSHGVPVVMLPDPNKSYAGDDVLMTLWTQFEQATKTAGRVLVLGHSLADKQLVTVLKQMPDLAHLGITYYGTESDRDAAHVERLRIEFGRLPALFPLKFGRKLEGSWAALEAWFSSGKRPPEP